MLRWPARAARSRVLVTRRYTSLLLYYDTLSSVNYLQFTYNFIFKLLQYLYNIAGDHILVHPEQRRGCHHRNKRLSYSPHHRLQQSFSEDCSFGAGQTGWKSKQRATGTQSHYCWQSWSAMEGALCFLYVTVIESDLEFRSLNGNVK